MKGLKLIHLLQAVLIVGIAVAFFAIYQDFMRFYQIEGVWFKFKDCETIHPFLTPCFWGGWAFVGAYIWVVLIYTKKLQNQLTKLVWFLMGGVIFAWSSFANELYKYSEARGQEYVGCSGAIVSNPFLTPCFYGSVLFLLALVIAYKISKNLKHKK